MTFSSDVKSKYTKGTGLKKVSTMDRFISIVPVDKGAIERVNSSVLLSAKQNKAENIKGMTIAEQVYIQ